MIETLSLETYNNTFFKLCKQYNALNDFRKVSPTAFWHVASGIEKDIFDKMYILGKVANYVDRSIRDKELIDDNDIVNANTIVEEYDELK